MIDIIIINYNCVQYLQELLEALITNKTVNPHCDYSITVVDNASTDGSQAMVSSQYPDVQLMSNTENVGYAAAVNLGVEATHHPVILLLNSDVWIQPEAVAALHRIWKRLDFPGVIGPWHVEEDGFPQQTWGHFPTPENEAKRKRLEHAATRRETWAKRELQRESSRTREVAWVSGSCMLFARTTFEEAGAWDETFFLFFEDIDWCLRLKAFGFSVIHTPEVQVRHAHGASVNSDPDTAEIEYRFSQLFFTRKHLGKAAFWKNRFYLTAKHLWRWLIGGWSGFERTTSWTILKETWKTPDV